MLNKRNLQEIKRKGNEPPCLLLLMYNGPSKLPSPIARTVTRRLIHSPKSQQAWWLGKYQTGWERAGDLREGGEGACAQPASSHP